MGSRVSRANRCVLQVATLLGAVRNSSGIVNSTAVSWSCGTATGCVVRPWQLCQSSHHRTPMGGRGPRLLLELWAEGSESRGTEWLLSPLFAPDLLFNVLRRNRVSMSWWVTRNWLTHAGRRWSAVLRHHARRRWAHTIRRVTARRRWAIGSWASSVRLKRIAWRVATTAAHRRTGSTRHATS